MSTSRMQMIAAQAPQAPKTFRGQKHTSLQSSAGTAWWSNWNSAALPAVAKCLPPSLKSSASRSANVEERVTHATGRWCGCSVCGRRQFLDLVRGAFYAGSAFPSHAIENDDANYTKLVESIHPRRPDWYEELYARLMIFGMKSYESEVEAYKVQLFNQLDSTVERILELGIGTGPNMKYYANRENIKVTGVDPNTHMEKYAKEAAYKAGLSSSQFEFLHAVAESLPIPDSSVDAVISTLVLCSVKDVPSTLKEVRRVLKPGGEFLFVEHVAAPEGSWLRNWQKLLNPIQVFVADGCHLDRETLRDIQSAGFEPVNAQSVMIKKLLLVRPHIVGIAKN